MCQPPKKVKIKRFSLIYLQAPDFLTESAKHKSRGVADILEDIDKAKKAFEMASKYGDCRADIKLANFYIKGIGVGKNISKAEKYLKSAKKECPDEVEKFEEELTII